MIDIRTAQEADLNAICAFDHVAQAEEQRRQFLCDSVREGIAYVAMIDDQVVGYAVLEYSFFRRGFISMLLVHPNHRRSGIGAALIRHLEGLCQSDRIFTSTNESNLPMRSLLEELGYTHSGTVDDLDPGDPELFYSKLCMP